MKSGKMPERVLDKMGLKQKNSIALRAVSILLFAVIFVIACVTAVVKIAPLTEQNPRTLAQMPNPTLTVTAFFDAVESNDFDLAASYTSNYSSLGFEAVSNGDAVYSRLYSLLTASYSYRLAGECSVESKTAVQGVDFTFFDIEKITPKLAEYSQDIAYSMTYAGETVDEEAARKILDEAFGLIGEDISEYLVTKSFELRLEFDGETWRIELPAELLGAIAGSGAC